MRKVFVLFFIWGCLCSCGKERTNVEEVGKFPDIFPDYQFVTIPVNIAPLNFKVPGADRVEVEFSKGNAPLLVCRGKDGIQIPLKKWRSMLGKIGNGFLAVKVYAQQDGKWKGYNPFQIKVVSDSIDPYIAYRLIEPGYELGSRLSLYQRELSSFDEEVFVPYSLTNNDCVNCHAFHNYSPDKFMFHVRQTNPGTIVVDHGAVKRVNTKTAATATPGSYRMWHPSGRYIAFSNCKTYQAFHAFREKKIEVYDLVSDLMIYDVENNKVLTDNRFLTKDDWETFPAWSPDGKYLYFCRAKVCSMPMEYKQLKYGIYRVAFNEADGTLADSVETVIDPEVTQKSTVYPSVSPDGRFLLYSIADGGVFPVYHEEADLEMLDLRTGRPVDIRVINSPHSESYHVWSSSGRWIVFSSRRIDNGYTHVYFAHVDENGKVDKPFVLPQKNPDFYRQCLKSFNVPELIKGRITISPYQLEKAIKGPVTNAQ